jgi:queuine tRNA-ribosyltransferase
MTGPSVVCRKTRSDQALFGIVQGGIFADLRQQSAAYITSLGFRICYWRLSVGDKKKCPTLDIMDANWDDKPRYRLAHQDSWMASCAV